MTSLISVIVVIVSFWTAVNQYEHHGIDLGAVPGLEISGDCEGDIVAAYAPGKIIVCDVGGANLGFHLRHELAHHYDNEIMGAEERGILEGIFGEWRAEGGRWIDQGAERFASAMAWATGEQQDRVHVSAWWVDGRGENSICVVAGYLVGLCTREQPGRLPDTPVCCKGTSFDKTTGLRHHQQFRW